MSWIKAYCTYLKGVLGLIVLKRVLKIELPVQGLTYASLKQFLFREFEGAMSSKGTGRLRARSLARQAIEEWMKARPERTLDECYEFAVAADNLCCAVDLVFAKESVLLVALSFEDNEGRMIDQVFAELKRFRTFESFLRVCPCEVLMHKDPSGIYRSTSTYSKIIFHDVALRLARNLGVSVRVVINAASKIAASSVPPQKQSNLGYYFAGDFGLERLCAQISGVGNWYRDSVRWQLFLAVIPRLLVPTILVFAVARVVAVNLSRTQIIVSAVTFGVLLLGKPLADFVRHCRLGAIIVPRHAPSLVSAGVDLSSVVCVVPVIFDATIDSSESVSQRIREIQSRAPQLAVYILVDFVDSSQLAFDPAEIIILRALLSVESSLNDKGHDVAVLVRNRRYSKWDGNYQGWERKRGKILEFNNFLLNKIHGWRRLNGQLAVCRRDFRQFVLLDEDTVITTSSAVELMAVAQHPLNTPVVGRAGLVDEGYAFITAKLLQRDKEAFQPRLLSSDNAAEASGFLDPFSSSIRSYGGKGLFNVDAIDRLPTLPEAKILSHDVLEGCFGRVANATMAVMSESMPSSFDKYLSRSHRWTRGNIQNLLFLLSGGDCLKERALGYVVDRVISDLRPCVLCSMLVLSMFSDEYGILVFWITLCSVAFVPVCIIINSTARLFLLGLFSSAITGLARDSTKCLSFVVVSLALAWHHGLTTVHALIVSALRWRRGDSLLEWNSFASAESISWRGRFNFCLVILLICLLMFFPIFNWVRVLIFSLWFVAGFSSLKFYQMTISRI